MYQLMQFWDGDGQIASILVSSTKKTEYSAVDAYNYLKVKCVSPKGNWQKNFS